MDSDQRYWLTLWSVVAAGFVAIIITIVIGLHLAQVNGTEQMKACVAAGMSFVDQDGNGTCIK